jgi:hypothetical protein
MATACMKLIEKEKVKFIIGGFPLQKPAPSKK